MNTNSSIFKVGDRKARLLSFEDISVGTTTSFEHKIDEEDVQRFAQLTGDYNPLHLDQDFANKTGFGKPVVYGMLSASYISTMIGMLLPGRGALWTSQTLEFLKPAFIGDTITVLAKVIQKSQATRALVLEVSVRNQHGQVLVSGTSNVKVLKSEESAVKKDESTGPRTYLITGATGGIGAATALHLAKQGHSIIVNTHSKEAAAVELVRAIEASGGKAIVAKANVADLREMEKAVARGFDAFGAIDGLVHCASPPPIPVAFSDLGWETFQSQLDIQLKGAFNCAQLLLPRMIENKSGSIVFIGSIYSDGTPPTQLAAYVAAKSALAALAKSLAVEFGPKGIRVNMVSPGMTQTPMISTVPDKTKMLTKMQTPLRRLAEPQDIAKAAEFLLSDSALHISGETLRVCGGVTML